MTAVISGFGGRIADLLFNTQVNITFRITAIYDPNFWSVYRTLTVEQQQKFKQLAPCVRIYTDDERNMYINEHFQAVLIGSRNDKHWTTIHLLNELNLVESIGVFCEKPIIHNYAHLNELKTIITRFKWFQTGLTLRYAPMTNIVITELRKANLGKLQQISGYERVNIGHGGQIIMKNWRRNKSISGGLGHEKCIHDYDILMYLTETIFSETFEINNDIPIRSLGYRQFWVKSKEKRIMQQIDSNPELSKCYHKWDTRVFQRLYDSSFAEDNELDVIPDIQFIKLTLKSGVEFYFEVNIGDSTFRTKTERAYTFKCENGTAVIDVIDGHMKVYNNNNELLQTVDLQGDGTSHAGGDHHVTNTMNILITQGNNHTHNLQDSLITNQVPDLNSVLKSTEFSLIIENELQVITI